jgi:hypothetical protein
MEDTIFVPCKRMHALYIKILPAIMEDTLFVPCNRMHALMHAWDLVPSQRFEEVELRPGAGNVAVDFSHHPDFAFDQFWQLTLRKIVWLGPDIFFKATGEVVGVQEFRQCSGCGPPLFYVGLPKSVNTGRDNDLHVCSRSMTDATTTVCVDVFQWMTSTLLYFREFFGYEQDTSWNNELEVYSLFMTDATTTACDNVFRLMTRSNTI